MRWWPHPGRLRFQRKAEEEGLSGKGQGRTVREAGESGGDSDFQSSRRGFCEESQVVGVSCTLSSLISSILKACSCHLSTLRSQSIWYLGASWWPRGWRGQKRWRRLGNGAVFDYSFCLTPHACTDAWFQMLPPQRLTSAGLLHWRTVLQLDLPIHGKWFFTGQTPGSGKGLGHGQRTGLGSIHLQNQGLRT